MAEKTRQYYKLNKKYRDQQREIEMWRCFQADPSLKYWLALGGGTLITSLLSIMATPNVKDEDRDKLEKLFKRGAFDYAVLLGGGGITGVAIAEAVQQFQEISKDNPLGTLVGMSATWTGINAACMILSSAAGNKDGAGMLGKIVTSGAVP